MTVTIEAGVLSRAMKSAASIVESAQTIPILANARIEVLPGGTMDIVTSNLDIEFRQSVPVVSGASLATTVDARKLAAIAGATESGAQIAMEAKDGRLTVRSGRSRWTLPVLPVTDFPAMPFDADTQGVSMPGKDLASVIARTAWSTTNELSRPYLSGIFLNCERGKLRAAATNGFSLFVLDTSVKWPADAPEIIVPSKYARILERIVAEVPDVDLLWDIRKIRARIGDVTLTGKVIDGDYLNYRRAIPQPQDAPIIVDVESLRKAMHRVSLIQSDRTKAITFDAGDGKLNLRSADTSAHESTEEIPADCTQAARADFYGPYLRDAMEAIGGDTVEIHHIAPDTITLIRRTVSDGAVCCVKALIG